MCPGFGPRLLLLHGSAPGGALVRHPQSARHRVTCPYLYAGVRIFLVFIQQVVSCLKATLIYLSVLLLTFLLLEQLFLVITEDTKELLVYVDCLFIYAILEIRTKDF